MTVELSNTRLTEVTQDTMARVRSARLAAIARELEAITPREPGMDNAMYAAMIKRMAMGRVFDEELRRSIR